MASFIGLLALGAAYLLFESGMKVFRQIENQTIATRASAEVVQKISRGLREAPIPLTVARDYEIQFLADPEDDGTTDRVRFYIPTGTTTLMEDTATASGVGTRTVTVDRYIKNLSVGTPLFSYYDTVGGSALTSDTARLNSTQIVRLTVVTSANTTPAASLYRDVVDLFLRNAAH